MKKHGIKVSDSRQVAVHAVESVLAGHCHLDEVLAGSAARLKEADRRLARAISAVTIRRLNTLDWILLKASGAADIDGRIRNIMRVGACQILFLDRIPAYAAVNAAVAMARNNAGPAAGGFVNAVLRKLETFEPSWRGLRKDRLKYLSIRYSMPFFLTKRLVKRLGIPGFIRFARKVAQEPTFCIRVNVLRADAEMVIDNLADHGFQAIRGPFPDILHVDSTNGLHETGAFRDGWIYVQDAGSAMVSRLIGDDVKNSLLDYCAAPGGKITHIVEYRGGRITALAHDRPQRLRLLRENVKRLGTPGISITSRMDSEAVFDTVLVDAPCTGTGIMGRHPELRWRAEQRLKRQPQVQMNILLEAAKFVAPLGHLYYSTCSLEPEENELLIPEFCRQADFRMVPITGIVPGTSCQGFVRTWPHIHDMDGFTVFRLIRRSDA